MTPRTFFEAPGSGTNVPVHATKVIPERYLKKGRMARAKASRGNLQDLRKAAIGIELQLEQVRRKLETVQSVGLVGMGGVGKTTLAKAIFDELSLKFDYSCFVPDVKSMKRSDYFQPTVELLWKHTHYKGEKVGEDDRLTLRGKRFLLVLDDIREDNEIDILLDLGCSPDSRFIATSRNRDRVRGLGYIHEVCLLGINDSKELFLSHAFPNRTEMPHQLEDYVSAILTKCCGLPLTLEVLGNFLRMEEDPRYWRKALKALVEGNSVADPNGGVQAALRVSYENLHETAKRMFLDATTFFNNGEFSLRAAKAAWSKAYDTYSESDFWQTLVNRSLVIDVEEDEIIRVHEQCQSVGQLIAAEYSEIGPCWMWEQPMALKLLRSPDQCEDREGRKENQLEETITSPDQMDIKIETGIESSFGVAEESVHIASPALRKLQQLRFLNINHPVVIYGSQEDHSLLQELVVLQCVGLQILNLALHSRLVVLNLSLPDVENLPTSIGQLSSLKIFVLSDARELENLPEEIGRLSQLESLELRSCVRLQTLPDTFGRLSKLKHLKFSECLSLPTLTDSFGQLSSLEQLRILRCENLSSLPESFGQLTALVNLEFSYCGGLKTLPESFGQLPALNQLSFGHCSLESLPESFGQLTALVKLEFSYCGRLKTLPESFGHMPALNQLNFRHCSLESLPEAFGQLAALVKLEFSYCGCLKTLPESFGQLPALNQLSFGHCSLESLPGSFARLSTLKELELSECENMRSLIPYGKLMRLEYLTIDGEYVELSKMVRLRDSTAGLTPPQGLVTMAPQMTANGSLPDSLHYRCTMAQRNHVNDPLPDSLRYACKRSVEEPGCGCHPLNATEELSEFVEDLMAEIKKVDKGGFLVSAEWLHNLEQHEKEVLMSVLREARFSEVYHTSTNILYKRLDQNNADVSYLDVCNDASCAGCISDPTRSRTKPAREEIGGERSTSKGRTVVDTDRKASKNSNLSSPKGKEELTVPTEQLSTSMRSFIAALKERAPRSYFVSTEWLSQLEHNNELEMFKSMCTENGFVETYRTSSTAYFGRMEDNVSTSNDGSTRSGDDDVAGRPFDTAISGEDKKPSDSHLKDQRSFKTDNEDDVAGALPTAGATQPRPKSAGNGCVEQLLEVTCTPSPDILTGASTSSQNLTPEPRDFVILSYGDTYVTLPILREDYKIATKVEKTYIVQQYQYRKAKELIKENVFLQVSVETTVSCDLRSDNNEKEVRVRFSKLKGKIKHVEGPYIFELVLESVRTNVGAGIYVDDIKRGHIHLDLNDPKFRQVDDEVRVAPCGEGPTSARPGTLNFELRCDGRTRTRNRWLALSFQDRKRPVTIEGEIPPSFSDAMSLKLFVKYQVVLFYTEAYGCTGKPYVRTKEARSAVELDCSLNYRARSMTNVGVRARECDRCGSEGCRQDQQLT